MDLITREIGIDAGHRVTNHGSKCRNLHGHRYTIQASCGGGLVESGPSEGMILDFGFLKEEMMLVIDSIFDHGFILWDQDPLAQCRPFMDSGKIILVPFVPTAENLARYWALLLQPRVILRSGGVARLARLRVYETPNCWADHILSE
jgi:6-pyruvoyltetrahydropterin/6-carboxytetrahydropterin synthase